MLIKADHLDVSFYVGCRCDRLDEPPPRLALARLAGWTIVTLFSVDMCGGM